MAGQMSATGSLTEMAAKIRRDMEQDVTLGVRGATGGAVQDMRQALGRAFPASKRMPTMVTGKAEPSEPGRFDLMAAGRVYGRGGKLSAWPAPLWAQAFGAQIAPKQGKFLAIPTKLVPRDSRNRKLTPREVELVIGEDLTFVPAGRFGKSACLVLLKQTIGRSGRVRAVTAGRARQGRKAQPIVMFWLVRESTLAARWDPRAVMKQWADLVPYFIDRAKQARESSGG